MIRIVLAIGGGVNELEDGEVNSLHDGHWVILYFMRSSVILRFLHEIFPRLEASLSAA